MKSDEVLNTAAEIVAGPRAATYGDKVENANRIADLWSVYLGVKIEPWQAMMMLGLLKVAREANGTYHADNYIDLAGYAAISGEVRGHYAEKD